MQNFLQMWPWKLGQGHQNLVNSSSRPNVKSRQIWIKNISRWQKKHAKFPSNVTLKIGSRSPKPSQLFITSQCKIQTNLDKNAPIGSLDITLHISHTYRIQTKNIRVDSRICGEWANSPSVFPTGGQPTNQMGNGVYLKKMPTSLSSLHKLSPHLKKSGRGFL